MQIVPFLTHYLLVYANFDFSSFSLISYIAKGHLLMFKRASFTTQKGVFYKPVCNLLIYYGLQRQFYMVIVCFSVCTSSASVKLFRHT